MSYISWFTTADDDGMSSCFCGAPRTNTVRMPIGFLNYERGICRKHYDAYRAHVRVWLADMMGC